MTGCVQTATTTCVSVPTKGLVGISANYHGRGTQANDVLIAGLIIGAVVLVIALIAILDFRR